MSVLEFCDTGLNSIMLRQNLRTWIKNSVHFWHYDYDLRCITTTIRIHTFLWISTRRHPSVQSLSEEMQSWIWSAVTSSVFTRPKEQWQCVIRGNQTDRACPKHSWHRGLISWEALHPFWLMWEWVWETWNHRGTKPYETKEVLKVGHVYQWPKCLTVKMGGLWMTTESSYT